MEHRSFRLTPIGAKESVVHRSFRLTPEANVKPIELAEIRQAFVMGLFVQLASLAFTALLLDLGVMFRCCLIATIAYWCFVIMFALRGARPTEIDLFVIKYGIWPFTALVVLIAPLLGR
jgi:hypothetical protein